METIKKTVGRKKVHATASDRQRAYLKRCAAGAAGIANETTDPGPGVKRLDVQLPFNVALTLTRLARHNGTSKAALLVKLISDAERAVTENMTDDQFDEFIG